MSTTCSLGPEPVDRWQWIRSTTGSPDFPSPLGTKEDRIEFIKKPAKPSIGLFQGLDKWDYKQDIPHVSGSGAKICGSGDEHLRQESVNDSHEEDSKPRKVEDILHRERRAMRRQGHCRRRNSCEVYRITMIVGQPSVVEMSTVNSESDVAEKVDGSIT